MPTDPLEHLWEEILSQEPPRIRRAWGELTDDEASAVLAHLTRMRDEPGWTEAQRQAASAALRVLHEQAE
jgi:hypothetical protein